MESSIIKKIALSGLIIGVAFSTTVPAYAAKEAVAVVTVDGQKVIFTGVSKEYLHIREEATVNSKSLAVLPRGSVVKGEEYTSEVTEDNPYKEWVKIEYKVNDDEIEGFVAKEFLEEGIEKKSATPAKAKVQNKTVAKSKSIKTKSIAKAKVVRTEKAEAPVVQEAKAVVQKPIVKEEVKVEQTPVEKAPVVEESVKVASTEETPVVKEKTKTVESKTAQNNKEKVSTSGSENKVEKPAEETVVKEIPKTEKVVKETTKEVNKTEQKVQETPKSEKPVEEAPKTEQKVQETPKVEQNEHEAPIVAEPVKEIPKTEIKKEETPSQNSGSYTTKMEATAYTATGNKTATGTVPKKGTVAVDPSVIPLGTELYVEGYGKGVAEDTGGAIKGNIIDVYMDSEQEARQWGRKTVNVTIYNYNK